MPDVIAVRNELLPESDRERKLAYNLNDEDWMNEIDAKDGVVFLHREYSITSGLKT